MIVPREQKASRTAKVAAGGGGVSRIRLGMGGERLGRFMGGMLGGEEGSGGNVCKVCSCDGL